MPSILSHHSLQQLNTFGFDVHAQTCVFIENIDQLTEAIAHFSGKEMRILGGGSNVVLTQDVDAVLLINRIQGVTTVQEDENSVILEFGGGESWHQSVMYTVENGWGGLENLSLIPGTVGAAPIQNIGAYGSELKDTFVQLSALNLTTGEVEIFTHEDCRFGYRESVFKHELKGRYFIISVQLKLSKSPEIKTQYGDIQQTLLGWGITNPGVADVSRAVIHIRQSKLPDPAEIGNSGSFFKNPVIDLSLFQTLQQSHPSIKSFDAGPGKVKVPAGWLIEQAGWKGYREGNVGVHEKQALVLVNYGGGTGAQVLALAKKIQADILHKFQIPLEMEVNAW